MDPTLNQSWETSLSPRTYATGGIVRIAPTIALSTPKPRKSFLLMGSLCSSANPYVPSRKSPELWPELFWRRFVSHRIARLIIYGERHPRIGFHETHVERDSRRQDPQSQQDYPVTHRRATV